MDCTPIKLSHDNCSDTTKFRFVYNIVMNTCNIWIWNLECYILIFNPPPVFPSCARLMLMLMLAHIGSTHRLLPTHRWLVPCRQNEQADLEVTFDPSGEVVRVTQQQPFPQKTVSYRKGFS